jgi:hypothetical protein
VITYVDISALLELGVRRHADNLLEYQHDGDLTPEGSSSS